MRFKTALYLLCALTISSSAFGITPKQGLAPACRQTIQLAYRFPLLSAWNRLELNNESAQTVFSSHYRQEAVRLAEAGHWLDEPRSHFFHVLLKHIEKLPTDPELPRHRNWEKTVQDSARETGVALSPVVSELLAEWLSESGLPYLGVPPSRALIIERIYRLARFGLKPHEKKAIFNNFFEHCF